MTGPRAEPGGSGGSGDPAGRAELLRTLGVLCEPPGEEHRRLGALLEFPEAPEPAAHTGLFLLELHPYASVYLGPEGMLGGEARDRVAGFWRVLERAPPPEPDHLAALLGLYASLCDREAAEPDRARRRTWLRVRRALLWEHLLSWLGPWLWKVRALGSPFYAAWAGLLWETLVREVVEVGPLASLPLHLREAPALADPRRDAAQGRGGGGSGSEEGAGGSGEEPEFPEAVLAAARSGMILTRSDLGRAGRELDLGVRIGERAYALRNLLAQDARACLGWLAGEAREWSGRHRRGWGAETGGPIGTIADWWADRARAAEELLASLARADGSEGKPARPGPAVSSPSRKKPGRGDRR